MNRTRVLLLPILTSAGLLISNCFAQQQSAPSSREAALKAFLLPRYGGEGEPVRYFDFFVDLNGDGNLEAIVYLEGEDVCGSGGCTMLVLTAEKVSYRIVTETTVTRRPIRVLETSTHGWRTLAVFVSGGGVSPGEVALDFDGRTYPKNPTVARRLATNVPGQVVIPAPSRPEDINRGKPLR